MMLIDHLCEGCQASHTATLWLCRDDERGRRLYICFDAYTRLALSDRQIWGTERSVSGPTVDPTDPAL